MPNAIPGEKLRLFANCTNLFITGKTVADLQTLANTQLNKLNIWFTVNKLHLSIEKTFYSIFSNSAIDNEIDIRVWDKRIQTVSSCKYVGVITDAKVKFTMHI
jgi:hypothetical protein